MWILRACIRSVARGTTQAKTYSEDTMPMLRGIVPLSKPRASASACQTSLRSGLTTRQPWRMPDRRESPVHSSQVGRSARRSARRSASYGQHERSDTAPLIRCRERKAMLRLSTCTAACMWPEGSFRQHATSIGEEEVLPALKPTQVDLSPSQHPAVRQFVSYSQSRSQLPVTGSTHA